MKHTSKYQKILKIRNSFISAHTMLEKQVVKVLFQLSLPREIKDMSTEDLIYNKKNYKSQIQKYQTNDLQNLLHYAHKEKNAIQKNPLPKIHKTVVLVHPFYVFLRHLNLVKEETEKYKGNILEYYKNIHILLADKQVKIVLIDSPDSFLFCLSIWRKYKPDTIIFTEHNNGKFLGNEKVKVTKATIGGCYLDLCISDVIRQLSFREFIIKKGLFLFRPIITPEYLKGIGK